MKQFEIKIEKVVSLELAKRHDNCFGFVITSDCCVVTCAVYVLIEAKRRKWLEDNPETTSNDEPVLFDTSIIPWWAWMKRYHLPEAELLNGYFPKHYYCPS